MLPIRFNDVATVIERILEITVLSIIVTMLLTVGLLVSGWDMLWGTSR